MNRRDFPTESMLAPFQNIVILFTSQYLHISLLYQKMKCKEASELGPTKLDREFEPCSMYIQAFSF